MTGRMVRLTVWALAALLTATPLTFAAPTPQEVEEDNSLASELVTPHKAWARPWAGGQVSALFFVHTGPYDGTWEDTGTRVREVVELAQRFDIRADAALFCGPAAGDVWTFHGGELGEQRAERLLERPYDLYVIAGFQMEKLPEKIRYLILEQVTRGAGLLCCGPGAPEYLTTERLLSPPPAELTEGIPAVAEVSPDGAVAAYKLGKGRAVWLQYSTQALTPYREFTWRGLAEYDYHMLLVGRAALWAASREGAVSVAATGGAPLVIQRSSRTHRCEFTLVSAAARPMSVTVGLELCRASDGLRTPLRDASVTLVPGEPLSVPAALPRLRAGDYFVDAVVRSRSGVEGFGAQALTVASDYGVAEVKLDQTFAERGDAVTGAVTLRGEPPEGSVLRVRLRDSYGRITWQSDLGTRAAQAQYPFRCAADDLATTEMRVEAVLLVRGEEVEQKDAFFTVPKRRHGQFNFVMWDAPNDIIGYYAWRKIQTAGFNTCLIGTMWGRPQPPVLRACDASIVPYSTRILDPKDERGYMLPVCWNDEPAVTDYVRGIVESQLPLREQGVFVYSLGDEGVTMGCCVHPACINAYRRYLEGQYGNIEALNESWGTAYGSFDEVDLLDHADNMELAAKTTSYPRWYDRQAFARHNLMQFSGRFVEEYKRLDPQAITGFEGTGGFGDDYDAILGINGFYGPYPSIGDDIIRSAAPRELVRSNWMGYSKTGDALSDAAWRMVMKGKDSIWFWMWSGIGNWRGYTRPTLDFWPAIEDLTAEMRPVRQGLGDLLLRSRVEHSGIAIFYSVPSALSSQLENGSEFHSAELAHLNWVRLTYDLGLDFRYITSGMLRRGALDNAEFRVLLLPMAQALSPDEAAAIRRFAERGGTVIADVRPGIYDGHCKPVMPGLLDDLFGIRRTGRGRGVESLAALSTSLDRRPLRVELPSARVDVEVEADSGRALARLGETPVLIVNRVGAGRAILLNIQPAVAGPVAPETAAARELARFLYEVSGAQSPVRFTSPDGGPLPLTEARVWRTGDALVIGLWRQMESAWFSPTTGTTAGPSVAAQFELASPMHVYDLRAGKYLGRTSRVDTELRWGRASFFLALPYRLPAPRVSLSSASPSPGERLAVAVDLPVPKGARETFAAWVEVTAPDGDRPLWGQRVVLTEGGRGKTDFRLAYNDKPGRWRVRATELFSGQSGEASWVVR